MKKYFLSSIIVLMFVNANALVGTVTALNPSMCGPNEEGLLCLIGGIYTGIAGGITAVVGLSTNPGVVAAGVVIADGELNISESQAQAILVQESAVEESTPVASAVANRLGVSEARLKSAVLQIAQRGESLSVKSLQSELIQ